MMTSFQYSPKCAISQYLSADIVRSCHFNTPLLVNKFWNIFKQAICSHSNYWSIETQCRRYHSGIIIIIRVEFSPLLIIIYFVPLSEMQQLLIAFLVFGVTLLPNHVDAARNSCYAPPFVYGSTCYSSTSIIGSPGYKIRYSIEQVNNVGTLICCQALACGPAYTSSCSGFRMYDIGCSTGSISATMPWGNNLATPAIKCKGNPSPTSIQWSP